MKGLEVTRFQWVPGCQFFKVLVGFFHQTHEAQLQFLWKTLQFLLRPSFFNRTPFDLHEFGANGRHGYMAFSLGGQRVSFLSFAKKYGSKSLGDQDVPMGPQFLDLDTCLKWSWKNFQPKTWTNFLALAKSRTTLEVLSLALAQPEHVVVLPQGTELKQKKPGRCWWEVHSYPVGSIYHWYIWV